MSESSNRVLKEAIQSVQTEHLVLKVNHSSDREFNLFYFIICENCLNIWTFFLAAMENSLDFIFEW